MHFCIDKCSPRYARRLNKAGQTEYLIQCSECLYGIKSPKHGGKLLVSHKDIPPDEPIFPWVPVDSLDRGLAS